MLFGIQQEGKHQYLTDLSKNVTRGLRERAERGEWIVGRPPYGYVVGENGHLQPGRPEDIKRVKVCRTETVCKQRYREGHERRARIRNLIAPLPLAEDTGLVLVLVNLQ